MGGGGIGGAVPRVGTSVMVRVLPSDRPSTGPGVHFVSLLGAPVKSLSPPGPPGVQPLWPRDASAVSESVILSASSATRKPSVAFALPLNSTPGGCEHLLLSLDLEKSAGRPRTRLLDRESFATKDSPWLPVLAQCIMIQADCDAPNSRFALMAQLLMAQVRPLGLGFATLWSLS